MDRTRVYIGVYENSNQESLFYQKDNNTYYDLQFQSNVSYNEIQKGSLIPYNKIIKGDASLRGSIIKLYEADRMKKMSLNRVFIGNVCKVDSVKIEGKMYGDRRSFWTNGSVMESIKYSIVKQDALLYSSDSDIILLKYADFKDIENGIHYEWEVFHEVNDIFISTEDIDIRPAKGVLGINSHHIQKGKLLEKYREYKKERGI